MDPVCLTCTCGEPLNGHGDDRNLLLPRLVKAAQASGLPVMEAAWSIPRTVASSIGADWPPVSWDLPERPAVVFDVDGVLAYTAEAMCTALAAAFGTVCSPATQQFFAGALLPHRLPHEQAAWLTGQAADPSFIAAYAPDGRAADLLRDCRDAGHDVRVVTEREPALAEPTAEWMDAWGMPPVPVTAVGRGNKPSYMAAEFSADRPAVLIDDNPLARTVIAGPAVTVMLPARSYNEGPERPQARRFTSWDQPRYWLGLGPRPA